MTVTIEFLGFVVCFTILKVDSQEVEKSEQKFGF